MRNPDSKSGYLSATLVLALVTIVPAACGGSAGGGPAEASIPGTTAATADGAVTRDVSGEFFGTIDDSVFGAGRAAAELSQYQKAAGGILTFTYGSTAFITPAAFVVNGSKLIGTSNFSISGSSGICTFSETATYKSGHLKGSYQAVSGCSGDHGTYTMKQNCSFAQRLGGGINFALKSCK